MGRNGMVMTCRICGKSGHNSGTCPLSTGNNEVEPNMDIPPPNSPKGKKKRTKNKVVEDQFSIFDEIKVTSSCPIDESFGLPTRSSPRLTPTKAPVTKTRHKLPVRVKWKEIILFQLINHLLL